MIIRLEKIDKQISNSFLQIYFCKHNIGVIATDGRTIIVNTIPTSLDRIDVHSHSSIMIDHFKHVITCFVENLCHLFTCYRCAFLPLFSDTNNTFSLIFAAPSANFVINNIKHGRFELLGHFFYAIFRTYLTSRH